MSAIDYARFGMGVWEWIINQDNFCGSEESEDILPIAQDCGLVRRVIYDPEKHGEIEDAEPGLEIWFWGTEKTIEDEDEGRVGAEE